MTEAIRIFTPPATTTQGGPPFLCDQATVRAVLAWNQDNPARPIDSDDAEKERRRLWGLLSGDPYLGGRLAQDCRPFDLLQWINAHLGRDSSPWTRRRWNSTIQTPFNAAEKLGLIHKNPFRGLSFPQGEDGRDWTLAEFRTLLRAAPLHFRRLIVFVRYSGLRPGEVRNLLWTDIKIDSNAIVIEKHKTRHKTKRPRRIPINKVIGRLLTLQRLAVPLASRHVFLNSQGQPWSIKATTKNFAAIRTRTGLPSDVKLHGGRHTFATCALMNGTELGALMELLGHRQLATTQRYVHVGDKIDHLQESMDQAIKTRAKRPAATAKKADPPMPLFADQ